MIYIIRDPSKEKFKRILPRILGFNFFSCFLHLYAYIEEVTHRISVIGLPSLDFASFSGTNNSNQGESSVTCDPWWVNFSNHTIKFSSKMIQKHMNMEVHIYDSYPLSQGTVTLMVTCTLRNQTWFFGWSNEATAKDFEDFGGENSSFSDRMSEKTVGRILCMSKFYKQKWTFGNEHNKVLCGLGSPHGLKKQWDDFSWWSQLVHKHQDCVDYYCSDVNHCFLVQGTDWPAEAFNHHMLWNVPFLDFQNDKHRMQWFRTGYTGQQCRRFGSIFLRMLHGELHRFIWFRTWS